MPHRCNEGDQVRFENQNWKVTNYYDGDNTCDLKSSDGAIAYGALCRNCSQPTVVIAVDTKVKISTSNATGAVSKIFKNGNAMVKLDTGKTIRSIAMDKLEPM